jgi:hypothetical protein
VSRPETPQPDTKDWTWTLLRPCPECGFAAAAVEPVAIPALVRDAVSRWPDVLARPDAAVRPAPTTWSALEYGCHVRDVCRIFTTRLQLMLDEDDPRFDNWDQDETALADRYDRQDPATVSAELAEAGEALAVAYTRVGPDDWARTGRRSNGSAFTVETLGQYALHDLFHHVWDVRG